MITIYNETANAWKKTQINDRISKLTMSVDLEEGKKRYLDLITSNDVEYTDLDKFVNMEGCRNLTEGNVSVKFHKKDIKPMIISAIKPNLSSDILLITIDLKKRIVKSIKNTRAAILNYFIAGGVLNLVVSVKEFENKSSFEMVLHDRETVTDDTYTFTKSKDNHYSLIVSTSQVDEALEKPTYRIARFRPSRATYLIYVSKKDEETFKNSFARHDKHFVKYFDGLGELSDAIEEAKKYGYKAVTYFADAESDSRITELLKETFMVLNTMTKDGKITFVK